MLADIPVVVSMDSWGGEGTMGKSANFSHLRWCFELRHPNCQGPDTSNGFDSRSTWYWQVLAQEANVKQIQDLWHYGALWPIRFLCILDKGDAKDQIRCP